MTTAEQHIEFTLEEYHRRALLMGRARNGLLVMVAALVTIGVVMIYSSSAFRRLDVMDPTRFLRRQILWVALASLVMMFFWHTNYRELYKHHRKIIYGIIIALVAVLIPGIGTTVNGARRWIRVAGIGIQPSEVAKLAAIIFSAAYAAQNRNKLSDFRRGFVPVFSILTFVSGLIIVEPDFGTAVFIMAVCSSILVVGGVPLRHFLPLALAGLPMVLLVMLWRFDHIKTRLLVFLYPDLDPFGKGHQIRQSLIALGSGGSTGVGVGASRQKLFFLPEDHTDFILAIIGEELGLVGTLLIVVLFIGLLTFARRVMNSAPDLFGHLLAFGLILALTMQAAMNIAVVTASMPTKGISLPFISFGGSSMVCSMAGVGILLNIADSKRRMLCSQIQEEMKEKTGRHLSVIEEDVDKSTEETQNAQ